MSEEILINVAPMETRVALLENGVLQDVYIERTRNRGIVGNIYKGKVIRVLPGMQAAFVDIGSGKAAFLHINDIWLPQLSGAVDQPSERRPAQDSIDIRTVLHEGQSLVVQVIKDPIASKGARLTTCLSISSRFVVYVPQNPHIGISQKIEDETERERLRLLVIKAAQQAQISSEGGFIVRTVAESASEAELLADIQLLKRLWESLEQRIPGIPVPSNLYEDLPLFMRTMRDLVHLGIERVRIDSLSEYHKMRNFADLYEPRLHDVLEFWSSERPIFDLYGVDDEIEKALGRRVDLKSGGYLIIDQTEAMTTIDVNTGAFVGGRNLEETIYKTNLEAASAIARQLRLRNLGGIIILDFIDMQEVEHQRQVLRVFEKSIERDRTKITVSDVSPLGLVEMTRKRTRESIGRQLCEPCPTCHGCGTVKSAETVCNEIFREIMREARTYDNAVLLVLASPPVIDRLLDEDSATVADIEELTGKTITFRVEAIYNREQYDIIPA